MKRLFFLLIVAVACVLPQSVLAANEASLDTGTKTLTITTDTPGQVATLISNTSWTLTSKSEVLTIILRGYFNESDLIALKGKVDADEQSANNGKFLNVTEVDMADAKFESASSAPSAANYKLYHTSTPQSGTEGERIIVGGTLFQSAPGLHWATVSAPSEGTTFITSFDHSSTSTSGHSVGEYGKDTPVTKYVQMNVEGESWSGPNNKGYNNFNEPSSATEITLTGSETGTTNEKEASRLATVLQDYYGGQWVYFNRYFKTQLKSGSTTEYEWIEGTQSDWNNATGEKYNNPNNVDFNNMSSWYASQGEHPESNVMLVKVYYQKQETSRYWSDYSETPSSYIDLGTSDYAYRDNHKNSYWSGAFKNGDIVKLTDYTYWQLQNDGTWGWVDASYADGDEHYINVKYANFTDKQNDHSRPTGANQYAVVMGTQVNETFTAATEKIRNDNDWKDPNAVMSSQYADMKFSYWSYTLQTATTSKFADDEINTDIFRDCKALTTVDFKAGVLKGFENHNKVNGYTASLSVTVGKDVTRIASSAFKDCDALTTITFDKDYSVSPYNTNAYPKVLTIDENAFLNSTNLTGITIPNRVSSIGGSAFHNAGNGDRVTEFSVTFERRYYDDKTSAEGDYSEGKDFDVPLTIGSGAFEDCKKLKTLSLPVRLTSLGERAFANTDGLQTLTMRETTSHPLHNMTTNEDYQGLLTIPSGAFAGSHVEEVTIPKSVILIESGAFQQTNYLSKLTFQENGTGNNNQEPLVIKSGAFAGGNEQIQPVLDVYVNIDPAKRKIICEYNAFTFTQLVGQTNEGSKQFGKLHFDEAYWDYYQGNWKRGLAFRQDNLNAFKDGYTDTSKGYIGKSSGEISTTEGKYLTGSEPTSQYTPANGWQQFASTSTAIDIDIPHGSFMRAFSTNTAYIIPTFATNDGYNKQGDPMFDIYRIVKFSDGYSDGKTAGSTADAQAASRVATAKQVVLTDDNSPALKYIPSETGLLMVGHISSSYLVYFDNAYFSEASHETKYPYEYRNIELDKDAAENNTNLLYPACINNHRGDGQGNYLDQLKGEPDITSTPGMIYLNSTIPCPYTDSNLKFRLFGYSPKKNQFIRTGGVNIARDKAYLKLTPEMFHWSNEYNGGENSGSTSGINDPSGARVSQVFLEFFDDEEESNTTGIKQVETTMQRMDSNVFYTLEGVKLTSRPTQRGIYIHNGRKVVIK